MSKISKKGRYRYLVSVLVSVSVGLKDPVSVSVSVGLEDPVSVSVSVEILVSAHL